jgi:holo-[acyl-carrier protein] synthase
MIVGCGIDLIEIDRIAKAVQNERFGSRVYTAEELAETKGLSHRLAGYFAAKEALLKAMGTGLSHFSWQEMSVSHSGNGAPYFTVSGKVRAYLAERHVGKIHLSISHSQRYAVAQVILEEGEPSESGSDRTDSQD